MKRPLLIKRMAALLMLSGIIAFIAYLLYASIGNYLWEEYDPITTDISSLSAEGAPNQEILRPFISVYGIALLVFVVTYTFWNFHTKRNRIIKTGSILLLIMAIVTKYGYSLFPLEGDKTQMTFQNIMHLVVTVLVVFLSIGGLFCLSAGYRRVDKSRTFGKFMLAAAIVFTLLGFTNPVGIVGNLNILGVTERLTIYTLHFIIALVGLYESVGIYKELKGA